MRAIFSMVVAVFLTGLGSAFSAPLTLSQPGMSPEIVSPASTADQERYALDDLKTYLGKMTGREVSLVNQSSGRGPAIFVGDVPENADLWEEIAKRNLGRDGFVIDVGADRVRILGGSKFGTAYGVYELLERLGVRWLFPGEWGDVVPKKDVLELEVGRTTDHPSFDIRQMHTAWAKPGVGDWFRRNRHNRSGFYGHSRLIDPKKYGREHPEWYAEIKGKRDVENPNFKLCHSNEDMVRQAIADVRADIRERESDTGIRLHDGYKHETDDYSIISISPTDGGGFCQCEKCLSMGSLSDRLQIFANEIAEAVREEFPDYSVGYYAAYSEAQEPATVKAGPGVVVFATTWTRDFFRPVSSPVNTAYRQKLEGFVGECPEMALRDFDGLSVWWGFGPFTLADVHASDYPWYVSQGLRGVITEAHTGWGPWGYSYYLMGRLWWNPSANIEALKRDYVQSAYGEAFEPMMRYHEKLDAAVVHPTPEVLHGMRKDLEEAAQLARREDVKQRITYLRAYYWQLDLLNRQQAGRGSPEDVVTMWRIVRSIDPNVSPITERALTKLFGRVQETGIQPFRSDELLAALDQVKLEEPRESFAAWSDRDDLRLVPFEAGESDFTASLGMNLRFGPATVLIYAEPGERIHVTQRWERPQPLSTSFELRDPDQVVAASGMAAGEEVLDVVAASRGVYALTLSTGGPYPEISVSNRYAVLKASGALQKIQPMGKVEEAYFYVPKGTKEFSITSKAYEPLNIQIIGPKDSTGILQRIDQKSQQYEEHRVTVPEGADGLVWKMRLGGGKKDIFLAGIPPLIGSSPERLLILPEDRL